MVLTYLIVEWSSVTQNTGCMTDGFNNELFVRNSSHDLNITGHWNSNLLFRFFHYSDIHYSDPQGSRKSWQIMNCIWNLNTGRPNPDLSDNQTGLGRRAQSRATNCIFTTVPKYSPQDRIRAPNLTIAPNCIEGLFLWWALNEKVKKIRSEI